MCDKKDTKVPEMGDASLGCRRGVFLFEKKQFFIIFLVTEVMEDRGDSLMCCRLWGCKESDTT